MEQLTVLSSLIRRSRLVVGVLLGLLVMGSTFSGIGFAQEQRLPGVIDRPPVEVPAEVTEPVKVEPKKQPEMERPEAPAETVATIKQVKFEGDFILDEWRLQKAVAPYLNRPLTRQDIALLKFDITKLYYEKGYVLVKVTTPPQDLAGGVLRVVVYPGRIGDLEIIDKGIHPGVTRAMTSSLGRGEVFNERTVETAVKDIDDINNIKARLTLKPGRELGTSDLVLLTEPAREDVQEFMIDNYGSELTGEVVGTVDLRKTNLLGMGENIRLFVRQSEEDLTTVQAEYKMPTLLRNIYLELHYLHSDNGIHDRLASLKASGRTRGYGAALSGNFVNMIQRQVGWRLGIEHLSTESFLLDALESRDDITHVNLDISYLLRKPSYVFYGIVRASKGVFMLGADREGKADASRLGGDPQAWRIMPTLYTNIRLAEKDFLQAVVQAQWASDTLLASDLFVLGGYGSVRGFEPAQEVGEGGISFSVDYNHVFYSTNKWDIKAGPFVDGGAVANRIKDTAVDSNLFSVGIGAEVKGRFIKSGESKLRVDWAHPVGSYKSDQVDDNTFYVRLSQTFVF